ncbi:MAG: hypothetical protein AB8C02_11865 [Halioglobus sp.]
MGVAHSELPRGEIAQTARAIDTFHRSTLVHTPAANSADTLKAMRALEYRITQNLVGGQAQAHQPHASKERPGAFQPWRWGDRLIAVLAVAASLIVVGSFLEELIWVVLAAGTIFVLGQDT